MVAMTK